MPNKRTALVFLHGGPGFRDYLRPYFDGLSDNFDCVFYDQVRGPRVEIVHLLEQLDSIVEAQSGSVMLVGHSWGGVLGTEYAVRHPGKVSGLAIMSTGLSHVHWFDEYRKEKDQLGLLEASAAEIFLAPHEREAGERFLDECEETFSEETFDHLSRTHLASYDLTSGFAELEIPILNIFGERDVRFPSRVTQTFADYNPRVINVRVAGAGHFPFLREEGRRRIHLALGAMAVLN